MKQGMPWWKYVSNRFLTGLENRSSACASPSTTPATAPSGREVLETVNLEMNSDKFIFDQEIMAQIVDARFRVAEVPVPTRYFPQASSASFRAKLDLRAARSCGCWRATCCTAPAWCGSGSSRACGAATSAPPGA